MPSTDKQVISEAVRPAGVRDHDRLDFSRAERDRLQRQLRVAMDHKVRAFDQGFAAAVEMYERGASLERMREMVRGDSAKVARGTVEMSPVRRSDEDDTKPIILLHREDS